MARVGFVGTKGSGRNTIAQLLRRFYDLPEDESGSIKVDGQNYRNYHVRVLRSSIQHVPSQPTILDMSIRDNIALGRRDASDEQIYRAALLANCTGFIEDAEQNQEVYLQVVLNGLKKIVNSLAGTFPSFKQLIDLEIEDDMVATNSLRQLLWDTLRYADL